MAPVRGPDGGNPACMPRRREPVVHRSADRSAPDRRFPRALMAGDEQHKPVAAQNRLLERPVDRTPGAIEAHPVKVDDAVGLNASTAEASVPASVERGSDAPRLRRSRGRGRPVCGPGRSRWFGCDLGRLRIVLFTRQRPDRGRNARPQRGFFRAERAHAPPPLWAAGSRRLHWPPFLPRCASHRIRRPRRCRSGLRP